MSLKTLKETTFLKTIQCLVFVPLRPTGAPTWLRGMSLKTKFQKAGVFVKIEKGFRPPSGNEFKNKLPKGILPSDAIIGFRPPSGNEFKNHNKRRHFMLNKQTSFRPPSGNEFKNIQS